MKSSESSGERLKALVNKPLGELTAEETRDLIALLLLHQSDYPWARRILKGLRNPGGIQPTLG